MTDKEKEAIEIINKKIELLKEYLNYGMNYNEYLDTVNAFESIVSLIQTQQTELEKKDKVIDEMAKYIKEPYQLYIFKGRMSKLKAIIEYFTKKVEAEGKKNDSKFQ